MRSRAVSLPRLCCASMRASRRRRARRLERGRSSLVALAKGIENVLHDEGIKVIHRALEVGSETGRLLNLLGQAHLRLNQDEEALSAFGRAIACEPSFADAYGNRANLLADMGRRDEALADFDLALKLRPNNAEDICNRATVLADLGRIDEALAGYGHAILLMPGFPLPHFNRADLLLRQGRLVDALAGYDRAVALEPRMVEAHSNRGMVLKELGRIDEAKAAIETALKLAPKSAEAMINRGTIAFEEGCLDEALADFARALEIKPGLPTAEHARGLALMAKGDWTEGFPLYEAREKIPAAPFVAPPYPRWNGEPLSDERLVLLCEQGLGDAIQFCRFGPLLAARGMDVTVLTSDRMRPLLSTLQGVKVVDVAPQPNGRPLRWLPLMSAPGVLGVRPDSIPGDVPYLAAEPERIERWRRELGPEGFKIGINWAPGPTHGWFGRRRALPLAAFAPLAATQGVRLISLQKGPAQDDAAAAPFASRIERYEHDPDPASDSFLDTAAIMTQLDLVVTCDTAVAHLAGALARPVFTALPYVADWRWLKDRDDSPWYPTMRLFRQSKAGDWSDVMARIAEAVKDMAREKNMARD
jgi:tetratricopeptide (TPR) repeat protein